MLSSIRLVAAALLLAATFGSQAEARLFGRVVNDQVDTEELILPGVTAVPDGTVVMASPVVAATNLGDCCTPCCPTPCISYRHWGLRKVKCCSCDPPVKMVLNVKNPCTCCPVDVPVCLPPCCTGEPKVSCRHGLLADGIVTYDWCCGVSVVVRFKKCGDVIVTYHGV